MSSVKANSLTPARRRLLATIIKARVTDFMDAEGRIMDPRGPPNAAAVCGFSREVLPDGAVVTSITMKDSLAAVEELFLDIGSR